ncbi:DNA modification methylase [Methylobacterium sp. NMS14P]|uniref:DNA modification methylase n=1 Tax=Methylobacterium sp. NMS14P TaxID=2894310 RepID=UPI002359E878|nr:DNA modification methylase [Methylobacterium sp. NMS14P]WCS24164.1 DNA modification methylase [Methylobacterium sp. NMS14P]
MALPNPLVPRKRTRSSPPGAHVGAAPDASSPPQFRTLQTQYWPIDQVKPYARELRTYHKDQQQNLQRNILAFNGPVAPILVSGDGTIIGGHALHRALKALGFEHVPVTVVDDLDPVQVAALRISLNKIQEMSSWNADALRYEVAYIAEVNVDLLVNTAIPTVEIDVLLHPDVKDDAADEADALPPSDGNGPTISVRGDIWLFKNGHALACGDARERDVYARLLGARRARMIVADVPYNVKIAGHVTKRALREFAMASGEMTPAEFTRFLKMIFENLAAFSLDGSIHLVFIDWAHIEELLGAGRSVYAELKNLIVWHKHQAGQGSLWRSQHELILAWKNGLAPHINNVQLGANGRWRSNVWGYAGANAFGRGRDKDHGDHPTPKSVAMIQDAILDVTLRGDIVLDPCAGSATTLVAAHKVKRIGIGIEVDPAYVDLGVRRLEKLTGEPARHAETGRTFAETAAERAGSGVDDDTRRGDAEAER